MAQTLIGLAAPFDEAEDIDEAEAGADPEVGPVVATLAAAAFVEAPDPLLDEHPLSSPIVSTHATATNLTSRWRVIRRLLSGSTNRPAGAV
jgi:hypothetical protein